MNTEKGSVGIVYADMQIRWSMPASKGSFDIVDGGNDSQLTIQGEALCQGNGLGLCYVVSASTYSTWCGQRLVSKAPATIPM
jgi:hypothetical protein